MKIKKIEAFTKNLALTKPYTIAYKTISDVENVFLLITLENGMTGIGAANPDTQVVGENPAQVLANCESDYCQSFVGRDIRNGGQWSHFGYVCQRPGTANAAIE